MTRRRKRGLGRECGIGGESLHRAANNDSENVVDLKVRSSNALLEGGHEFAVRYNVRTRWSGEHALGGLRIENSSRGWKSVRIRSSYHIAQSTWMRVAAVSPVAFT